MPPITITCYGICKGDPKWRSKEGFPCSLYGGSGKVTTYNERETLEHEWAGVMKSRAAGLERAERRRAGAQARK